MPNTSSKDSDFYRSLRARVDAWLGSEEGRGSQWADYVMLAPDLVHLLIKLSVDGDVPLGQKAKVAGALAYFMSPIDIIPEALGGPPGLLEDVALTAYVLKGILNETDPEVVRRHWAGERDLLELIRNIIERADVMLGAVAWRRVKRLVGVA